MENNSTPTKGIIMNYGLILGLASVIIASINFAIGNPFQPHWSVSVISLLASVTFIILGLLKFKSANDGFISLSEALKTGLGIALISALLYVVFQLILTSFVDPDFYTKALEFQRGVMLEKFPDMSDEQLESSLNMAEKFMSPIMTSAFALIGSLFIGFIISLIGGLIIKKNKDE